MKKSNGRKSNLGAVAKRSNARQDVIQRLRAQIFSPKRLLLPSILALGLIGGAAFGEDIKEDIKEDITIESPDKPETVYKPADANNVGTYFLDGGTFNFDGLHGTKLVLGDAVDENEDDWNDVVETHNLQNAVVAADWKWGASGRVTVQGSFTQYKTDEETGKLSYYKEVPNGDAKDQYVAIYRKIKYVDGEPQYLDAETKKQYDYVNAIWDEDWYNNLSSLAKEQYVRHYVLKEDVADSGVGSINALRQDNNALVIHKTINDGNQKADNLYGATQLTVGSEDGKLGNNQGTLIIYAAKGETHHIRNLTFDSAIDLHLYGDVKFTGDHDKLTNDVINGGRLHLYNDATIEGKFTVNHHDDNDNTGYVQLENGANATFVKDSKLEIGTRFHVDSNATLKLDGATVNLVFDNVENDYAQLFLAGSSYDDNGSKVVASTLEMTNGATINVRGHNVLNLYGNLVNSGTNNTINIDGGWMFKYEEGVKNENEGDKVNIVVQNTGKVVGQASGFQGTEITFQNGGGVLQLADYLAAKYGDAIVLTPMTNDIFCTCDPDGVPTVLEHSLVGKQIDTAVSKNHILSATIKSVDPTESAGSIWVTTYNTNVDDNSGGTNQTGYVGYAAVFGSSNPANGENVEDPSFENYGGDLTAERGVVALKGDIVFGNGNGQVDIWNQQWSEYSSKMIDDRYVSGRNFNKGGVLAFYRGDGVAIDKAPILRADQVNFIGQTTPQNADEIHRGATLWLDANFNDPGLIPNESDFTTASTPQTGYDYNLGKIEANRVVFAPETEVYVDGISKIRPELTLTFTIDANYLAKVDTFTEDDDQPNAENKVVLNEDKTRDFEEKDQTEVHTSTLTYFDIDFDDADKLLAGDTEAELAENATQEQKEQYFRDRYGLFGKALVDAELELGENGDYNVKLSTINVEDFMYSDAAENNRTVSEDERNIAESIDRDRLLAVDANDRAFFDSLYNEGNADRVRQTVANRAKGSPISPTIFGHIGNPTSTFFGGKSTTGGDFGITNIGSGGAAPPTGTLPGARPTGTGRQLYGPAHMQIKTQAPDKDWLAAVRQYETQQSALADMNASKGYDGQANSQFSRSVWATYAQTSIEGDGYQEGIINYDDFEIRRRGVLGGYRTQIAPTTTGGLIFAIATPEVWQDGELQSSSAPAYYATKMEMLDFQFGGHVDHTFMDNWELSLFASGGVQTFDWNRQAEIVSSNARSLYEFAADGQGYTFTATAYLSRKIDLTERWFLKPTIGVDSEHTWLEEFAENDVTRSDNVAGAGIMDGSFRDAMVRTKYDDMRYNRNVARVGLSTTATTPNGFMSLSGRAYYSTQLGGDAAVTVTASKYVSGLDSFENSFETHSNKLGRDAFSFGGGRVYLNAAKTASLSGDYNVMLYKYATTENFAGGFQYQF